MMADIRQATMVDIPAIQACDLLCFPEEDPWDYYLYEEYIDFWPRLVYVAEDSGNGCIVGFVFAQVDGEGTETHGYIANLGVLPTHRKSGIAQKLMDAAQNALVQEYGCEYVSLHVRTSNHAAISLFTEKLGYNYAIAANFYRNGEDAYVMRKQLQGKLTDHLGHGLFIAVAGRILLLLQNCC
ncbi:N-terminal acetyltransferase A complex catalytic subunit NAA10-like [Papaver somniferum]|nr:N-terminal acetyltransferase A complex catalytic subunit NAA10-like [Papaver somniferum]